VREKNHENDSAPTKVLFHLFRTSFYF